MKQDAMNHISPEGRWQTLRLLFAVFQILDQIKKLIYRPVLPGRPMLIHDRVNGDSILNARHLVSRLIVSKRLHDREGAMLTILGIPPPPDDTEDLPRTEVIDGTALTLLVMMGRRAEAQAIEPGARNEVRVETG
jgi:hypothetical protein